MINGWTDSELRQAVRAKLGVLWENETQRSHGRPDMKAISNVGAQDIKENGQVQSSAGSRGWEHKPTERYAGMCA